MPITEKQRLAALAKQNAQYAAKAAGMQKIANAKIDADAKAADEAFKIATENYNTYQTSDENIYNTTKVGTTGKTQAQLDAATSAAETAKIIGGTVDPKTGYVIPPKKFNPGDPPFNPDKNNNGIPDVDEVPLTPEQIKAKADAEAALNERRDAFALIKVTMLSYGFTPEEYNQLSDYLESVLLNPKIGPNQAIIGMRALPVYKQRFAGNEARVKAGLNALSEGDYLQQEDAYSQTFRSYGLQNMGNRAQYATLMGNDISNTELGKRVGLAVTRVKNADPEVLKTLNTYYSGITDTDLVSYFLNPKEVLPELQKKVTRAEIGATAKSGGFDYTLNRVSDLEAYGVDLATAREGYTKIGEVLPISTKLGDIYKEANSRYDQTSGESEFFKESTMSGRDAAAKRNRLKSLERAAFEGSAGAARGAFSTQYLMKNATAGSI